MKRAAKFLRMPLVFLAAHALLLCLPRFRVVSSNLAIAAAAAIATVAVYRRSRLAPRGPAASRWNLATIALALWFVGQIVFSYYDALLHILETTSLNSDLYFFLFGVPLLLAICSVQDGRPNRWLLAADGVQALVVVLLAHAELFSNPAAGANAAVPTTRLLYLYNAENLILLAACGIKLAGRPTGEQKKFYQSLFSFLVAYAAFSAFMNYMNAVRHLPTGTRLDLLWDLPFLVWTVSLSLLPFQKTEAAQLPYTRSQLVIANGSPMLVTLIVLTMATWLAQYRFSFGIAAVLLSVVSYGFRNSLLEVRYIETARQLGQSEAALQQANTRLREISYVDPLTGIPNRRKFQETLRTEWNRAMRRGSPLSLLMIDFDHFKLLNDRYGHPYGDHCLATAAHLLSDNLQRAGEMIARYGGEEFAAILPETGIRDALGVGERLRASIAGLQLANGDSPIGEWLTISVGVATCFPTPEITMEQLLSTADQALYRAKCNGRNCVESGDFIQAEST